MYMYHSAMSYLKEKRYVNMYYWKGRMAQLLSRDTPRSSFIRVQFPVKVRLWMSRSSTMK